MGSLQASTGDGRHHATGARITSYGVCGEGHEKWARRSLDLESGRRDERGGRMLRQRSMRGLCVLGAACAGTLIAPAAALAISQTPLSAGMTNGTVRAFARSGNTLYVGGHFTKMLNANGSGGVAVQNLGAIDLTTGQPISSFHPAVTGNAATVWSLALSGATLFVGGSFTTVAGRAAGNLAGVNTSSGAA